MKHITKTLALVLIVLTTISCKNEKEKTDETTTATDSTAVVKTQRIISLNGALTEIVAGLGHRDEIVGVDVTSSYPEAIKETAQDLGHVRSISVEAIMALKPTLVLATNKDISPELAQKIELAGVTTQIFEREYTPYGAKKTIEEVANILEDDGAEQLKKQIDNGLEKVNVLKQQPKVLFIYARGAGALMVSGKNTPVDKIITLAGGVNAIDGFDDYKPLTPEAVVKANPDVILMFNSGIQSLGGVEGAMAQIQGIDKTNAGKNKKIIAMDGGLLSGFGPRLGEAAAQLNSKLAQSTNAK